MGKKIVNRGPLSKSDKIEFVDQTIRDVQQSLWGLMMSSGMITSENDPTEVALALKKTYAETLEVV